MDAPNLGELVVSDREWEVLRGKGGEGAWFRKVREQFEREKDGEDEEKFYKTYA